jgi:hypothetical protein
MNKESVSNQYRKVGRINFTIAKQAHIKSAEIMIDENHIKHIKIKHGKELEQLGIDATLFVSMIVKYFTEIRQGKGRSLYLVLHNSNAEKSNIAAIELNYNLTKEFWEIKTAIPMRTAVVIKKKLLWKKGANPFR